MRRYVLSVVIGVFLLWTKKKPSHRIGSWARRYEADKRLQGLTEFGQHKHFLLLKRYTHIRAEDLALKLE